MANHLDYGKLRQRLCNWGEYLLHEADIGPKGAKCISIESKFVGEADEIWEARECKPTPNVADAEALDSLIRLLDHMERYCLALHYGGIPAVFTYRRIGEHAMQKMLENAENNLAMLLVGHTTKKRA